MNYRLLSQWEHDDTEGVVNVRVSVRVHERLLQVHLNFNNTQTPNGFAYLKHVGIRHKYLEDSCRWFFESYNHYKYVLESTYVLRRKTVMISNTVR